MSYSWPGNQREMSIFFEKAFLLTRTNRMDADFVQQLLYPERTGSAPQQQVLVISSDEERELVTQAVRFGLAALDHRDLG